MFFDNSPHGRLVVSQVESHGQRVRRLKINCCQVCGAKLRTEAEGLCRDCEAELEQIDLEKT
jgi:predicted amidophosphoribosyltransferase